MKSTRGRGGGSWIDTGVSVVVPLVLFLMPFGFIAAGIYEGNIILKCILLVLGGFALLPFLAVIVATIKNRIVRSPEG